MRLIDAEVFEELFDRQIELGATDVFDAVEDALQDTPTIDAVPVVRCGECKWVETCRAFGEYLGKNGFCSRGKRMDGEVSV